MTNNQVFVRPLAGANGVNLSIYFIDADSRCKEFQEMTMARFLSTYVSSNIWTFCDSLGTNHSFLSPATSLKKGETTLAKHSESVPICQEWLGIHGFMAGSILAENMSGNLKIKDVV